MLKNIPPNLKIIYDNTIVNLLQYSRSTNTVSWFMYTDDGVQIYSLFHELFHAYQQTQNRYITEVVNGKRIVKNMMNIETEAMIAAYKYVKEHGINESENEHCTIWSDKQKEKFDSYLDNPNVDNYNAVLEVVSNLKRYQQYKDRVMTECSNTLAMDSLFENCY